MKFLITLALVLVCSFSVQAQTPVPKVSHFDKTQFNFEADLLTKSIIGDAFTTLQDINAGFQEQKWPHGNEELLGKTPNATRFGLVAGGEEVLYGFVAMKLESSNHRFIRFTGHLIMYGGAISHVYGLGNNLVPQKGVTVHIFRAPSYTEFIHGS